MRSINPTGNLLRPSLWTDKNLGDALVKISEADVLDRDVRDLVAEAGKRLQRERIKVTA